MRAGTVLRKVVKAAKAAATPTATSTPPPPPPKVLVLTMVPNGGAAAAALRILGFNPYTFENTVRKGRVQTHPQEWMAVLRREKPFDFEVLRIPEMPTSGNKEVENNSGNETSGTRETEAASSAGSAPRAPTSSTPPPPRYFDSMVGPPATIAFEAILRQCPRSTRVILVEEPDKIAWEKDLDQWLQPLIRRCEKSAMWWHDPRLHRMLRDMTDLRRALIPVSDGARGPASSTAAMAARNVPIAQQQTTLRLAGALDLFEQHVKEIVPADRLLVYRVSDGWGPLCQFLGVPVPTAATAPDASLSGPSSDPTAPSSAQAASHASASGIAAPGAAAVTSNVRAPIPFPANTNGSDIFVFLDQGMQKATAVALLIVLAGAALGVLFLSAFRDELSAFYRDYRSYVRRDFEPYLDEEKARRGAWDDALTPRQALILAKKSTQRFGEAYEKEGGTAKSMTGVLRRFAGIAPEPAAAATSAMDAANATKLLEEKAA